MSSIVATYDLLTKGPQVVYKDTIVTSQLNKLSTKDEIEKVIKKIQNVIDNLQIIRVLSAIAVGYHINLAMNFVFTPLIISGSILLACNLLIMNLSNKLETLKCLPIPESLMATKLKISLISTISVVAIIMIYYFIHSTYNILTIKFSK